MSDKEEKNATKTEIRKFTYASSESGVGFDFELDVTDEEVALAEIADFIELLDVVKEDLKSLRSQFARVIEKPKAEVAKVPEKPVDNIAKVERVTIQTATK